MKTIKPAKNLIFTFSRLLIIPASIFLFSTPGFAYEEDTHFNVTYVICLSVGFTPKEALIVAAVDQGMDDSTGTVANTGIFGQTPHPVEEALWHALDKDGNMRAAGIIARRDKLFQDALNETETRNKLIRLGVFFHYQQDTWAHRHHELPNHLSRDNYTTFNTPLGHALFIHQPDRPPLDPVAALMCLEDGIAAASKFLDKGLGRVPNPFLANYTPQGGSEDKTWKSNKKGEFFNQIDLSNADPKSAHFYLLRLIRAQIDVYTTSLDLSPKFVGRFTADEADVDAVRQALEGVINEFKSNIPASDISIPTKEQKQAAGFTNLTTAELNGQLPAALKVTTRR